MVFCHLLTAYEKVLVASAMCPSQKQRTAPVLLRTVFATFVLPNTARQKSEI